MTGANITYNRFGKKLLVSLLVLSSSYLTFCDETPIASKVPLERTESKSEVN